MENSTESLIHNMQFSLSFPQTIKDQSKKNIIIEIYNYIELPHCIKNVYSSIFHALRKAENNEPKNMFPWLLDPLYDGYKYTTENVKKILPRLIDELSNETLQVIAIELKNTYNLEYDNDYDV